MELLVGEGVTFALTNQWGGRAAEALRNIVRVFAEDGISVFFNRGLSGAQDAYLLRSLAEKNGGTYAAR